MLNSCGCQFVRRPPNDTKMKKPPSYSKKTGAPPNHHSTSLYPSTEPYYDQRTLSNFEISARHNERSPLELNYKKKREKDREKERERQKGDGDFPHLPDVPGAEGSL